MSGARHSDRVGIRGERLLPAVEVRGRGCSTTTKAIPSFVRPESRLRGGRLLRRGGPRDLSVSRTKVEVGHPVPGPSRARRLRLARRARQLHHRARIRPGRRRRRSLPRVLGPPGRGRASTSSARTSCASTPSTGRRSCCRPAMPLPTRVWAHGWWLRDAKKISKSVGNIVRPDAPRRGLRSRRPALLPPARDGVRPGRDLLRRGVPHALQRGPRQRPRQHGVPRGRAAAPVLRRHAQRGLRRQRDPRAPTATRAPSGRRRWTSSPSTGRSRPSGNSSRDQRLRRRQGALEDPQGGGRRFRPPAPHPVRRGGGDPALGRDAVAVRSGDSRRIFATFALPATDPSARDLAWGGLPVSAAHARGAGRSSRASMSPNTSHERTLHDRTTKGTPNASPADAASPTTPASTGRLPRRPLPRRRPGCLAGGCPATTPPSDDRIGIEDFQKVRLKTAKIVSAERVPKSNKLMRLQVDLGARAAADRRRDRRAVRARGARRAATSSSSPTCKPAKLMGVESNGMVLAASVGEAGEPVAPRSSPPTFPPGAK